MKPKFNYRDADEKEVRLATILQEKINRLRLINGKIPLANTLKRFGLRSDFCDRKYSQWVALKNSFYISAPFHVVTHNGYAYCVTQTGVRIYHIETTELLFCATSFEKEWVCEPFSEFENTEGIINALTKAVEKAEVLYQTYENHQRKSNWIRTKGNLNYGRRVA